MVAAQDGGCGSGDMAEASQPFSQELGTGMGLVASISEAIQDGDRHLCRSNGRCRINPAGLPGSQAEGARGRSDLTLIQAKEGSAPRLPGCQDLRHSRTVVKPLR